MNDNILCLYYSRTGNTKKAMEEVAEALDCECLEIRDKVDRSGTMGYLRCCFDAMHKRTSAVSRPKCQKPLSDYKLVILGTPVWAGRCSSVIRGFLKRRGYEIHVVRQFGLYLSWAQEICGDLTLVREDRVGQTSGLPVVPPGAPPGI